MEGERLLGRLGAAPRRIVETRLTDVHIAQQSVEYCQRGVAGSVGE